MEVPSFGSPRFFRHTWQPSLSILVSIVDVRYGAAPFDNAPDERDCDAADTPERGVAKLKAGWVHALAGSNPASSVLTRHDARRPLDRSIPSTAVVSVQSMAACPILSPRPAQSRPARAQHRPGPLRSRSDGRWLWVTPASAGTGEPSTAQLRTASSARAARPCVIVRRLRHPADPQTARFRQADGQG